MEDRSEARLLWWSLVLFLVSELVCGVQVYMVQRTVHVLSVVHAVTTGIGAGLFALGLYRWLDRKLIRYGEDRCLANRFCRQCTFAGSGGCKFRSILLAGPVLAVLFSLGCFLVPAETMVSRPRGLELPFEALNTWFDQTVSPWLLANLSGYDPTGASFFISRAELLTEFRVLPAVTLLLAVLSIGLIHSAREHVGIELAVFAWGVLGYVFLEIVLFPAIGDVLLGSLGHELVELWFLVVTARFLELAFPNGE